MALCLLLLSVGVYAQKADTAAATDGSQQKIVPIKYGDMESWITRKIHESGIIGGHVKTLYELGPQQEIDGNIAYEPLGGSPWGNSNVMAKVAGVVKTNVSVYPEKRGNGTCARLETHVEKVKVLGLINITVIASGSLYLGDIKEPITSTKGGESMLNSGIPFTQRPKAVQFDYKVKISDDPDRTRLTGFSRRATVPGKDRAIMVCFLQKRTERPDGSIVAKRVGTAAVVYDTSTDWVDKATYPIVYGDASKQPSFNAEFMGLDAGGYYARNSKGESVQIEELGWANPDEQPTHMIFQFTSSYGGAFVGSPGNTIWVDNVSLVY